MTSYKESHKGKSSNYDQDLEEGGFDAFMAEQESRFLRRNIPILFPRGLASYLDFACGTGRITSVVEDLATKSFGVDVSESMQAVAKEKCRKTTFFLHDLTEAPLNIEPVQLVTAFRFFGNAEDPLRAAALDGISRQTASGGYLIINNHRNPSSISIRLANLRGHGDTADLSPDKLEAMLKKAGFLVVKVFGLGWWYLHHRLDSKTICQSMLASILDPISRLPGFYRYCPDYIVVAKKL
jgi:predicted TPR repeat methyltransferase